MVAPVAIPRTTDKAELRYWEKFYASMSITKQMEKSMLSLPAILTPAIQTDTVKKFMHTGCVTPGALVLIYPPTGSGPATLVKTVTRKSISLKKVETMAGITWKDSIALNR